MPMRREGPAAPRPLLLVVCLAAATVVAAAEEPVDVSALRAWAGRHVAGLAVEGVPDDLAGRAVDGLALKPRRKLLRLRKPLLTEKVAEADAQRLRLLMARNGFPHATVTARGEAEGDDEVNVTFVVDPGPAVVYGELEVRDVPDAATTAADSARIALPAGERFRERAVYEQRDDLLLALRRAGHPHAEVAVQVTRPDSGTADLVFACTPGATFDYQDLIVEGAPDDLEPVARKTVGLKPGTPYSPRVVDDARRNLRDLDLFRQIRLKNVPRDSSSLDLRAELSPRKMLTLEASVGTFTDNPVVVTGYALHRNIFKGGRGMGVGASYATHYRWVETRFWWQAIPIGRSRTDLRLRYEVEDEESYRLGKASATLSTLFYTWRHSSLRTAISVSNGVLDNRSTDPDAFIEDVGLQTVLSAKWFRDTSDNPLDPLTGSRLTLETDWSPPGFWTESPFASLRAYGSRYLHVGGERVVALRLDTAVAWPLGDAIDLTPDRRWYAGGVSTMRGYDRRRLGPLDSDGKPIGGEARLLAGVEYRMPLASIFGVALFLDTGQVWRLLDEITFQGYQASLGAGLLIGTPVGPLRFDYAHLATDPRRDEPRWQLHFAIGHPF